MKGKGCHKKAGLEPHLKKCDNFVVFGEVVAGVY